MFEVGKAYHIKMWNGGNDNGYTEYNTGVVIAIDMPLVQFKGSKLSKLMSTPDTIINTASIAFVSAEVVGR